MAPVITARRPGFVEDRHEPTLFALRDLRKDLDLAIALFGQSAVQAPLTLRPRSSSPRRRARTVSWTSPRSCGPIGGPA